MNVRDSFLVGALILFTMNVAAEEAWDSGQVLMEGQNIKVFDLATKQERYQRIKGISANSGMRSISKINDMQLLASFISENDVSWIYSIDVESWQALKLIKGRSPLALKGHNKFLFIATDQNESRHSSLWIANMGDNPISITQIYKIDLGRINYDYPLVQVSKDTIITSGPKGHSHEAYEIDINTLEYRPSPIGRCIPSAWFESKGQLLCGKGEVEYEQVLMFFRRQISETTYFLTSLDGKERKEWNEENLSMDRADFDRPLHYIPETDVLLILRERTSIGYGGALYAYDMKSKKQH